MQEAQNRLLEAQLEADRLLREAMELADQHLIGLYQTYGNALNVLNNLKTQLTVQQNLLLQYEGELIAAEDLMAANIAISEERIKGWQAEIDAYNAYTGLDKADLDAEVLRLGTVKDNALSDYLVKQQITASAETALDNMLDETTDIYTIGANTMKQVVAIDNIEKILEKNNIYINVLVQDVITFEDDRFMYEQNPPEVNVDCYALSESEITYARSLFMNKIQQEETLIGKPSTETTDATGLYIDLEAAEDALAAAEKADPQDPAYIEYCKGELLRCQEELSSAQNELAELNNDLETFESLVKEVTEGQDKYKADLEALKDNELVKAYFDAEYNEMVANDTYLEANAQYNTANNLANNYGLIDVQNEIRQLEQFIANEKLNILDFNTLGEEELLQRCKDLIVSLEAQIDNQQKIVDIALKSIEDYLATQE